MKTRIVQAASPVKTSSKVCRRVPAFVGEAIRGRRVSTSWRTGDDHLERRSRSLRILREEAYLHRDTICGRTSVAREITNSEER